MSERGKGVGGGDTTAASSPVRWEEMAGRWKSNPQAPSRPLSPQLHLWQAERYAGLDDTLHVPSAATEETTESSWRGEREGKREEAQWNVSTTGSCHLGKLRTHLPSKAGSGVMQDQPPALSQQGEAHCQDDNKSVHVNVQLLKA